MSTSYLKLKIWQIEFLIRIFFVKRELDYVITNNAKTKYLVSSIDTQIKLVHNAHQLLTFPTFTAKLQACISELFHVIAF